MLKLLPILLAVLGTGAGVGAALVLGPTDSAEAAAPADGTVSPDCVPPAKPADASAPPAPGVGRAYVPLANHFVVPVINSERVDALVVASISLEIDEGTEESVYDKEPKLRDVFLQVLMDHASIGGFEGRFTAAPRMETLRMALLEAARPVLGSQVSDILITEIARQDS